MLVPISFHATEPVRAAIADLGRTEDARFAPGNHLLALAGFVRRRCLLLRIDIEDTAAGPQISISDFMDLRSSGIGNVHGIDFIDDETLVFANRDGLVSVIRLPGGELGGRLCEVEPISRVRGGRTLSRVWRPGSALVQHEPGGRASVMVCNNYSRRVTRHVLDAQDGYRPVANGLVLSRGLDIPDGICVNTDGDWIAVSSHGSHDVKMFATKKKLRPWSAPAGVLRGMDYPHGLRFTADGRCLLVADAGAPLVHVYDRGAAWGGKRQPSRSLVVMDDATFARGRSSPEEGGPKGLDIDRSQRVVVLTCEEQPLAFFPLAAFTGTQ